VVHELRPSVIHSHNWSGLLYAVLANLGRRQVLLQGEHAQLTGWEKAPRRIAWRRWFYQRCDAVHTVSEGQKLELKDLGITQDLPVLSLQNGVDCDKFAPAQAAVARANLGLPKDGFYIGMVARCIADKRHDRALAAFANIASHHPDVRLLLAGDGGDVCMQVRASIAAHPHKNRIHWLGYCDQMPLVYQAMNLLIVPSETEGLSNACLEAMASSVPVLTNSSCGASEIVVEDVTGFIRPMADVGGLTTALMEVLHQPERLRTMASKCREHVISNFSLDAMTNRYENLYRHLAGSRSRSDAGSVATLSSAWTS
jgi:glycosyltransferase involved in cell wall biosynthesis